MNNRGCSFDRRRAQRIPPASAAPTPSAMRANAIRDPCVAVSTYPVMKSTPFRTQVQPPFGVHRICARTPI
jgi:hypothetical protein